MEENKDKINNASTILLVILIVAICIMGYYLNKNNNEKNNKEKKGTSPDTELIDNKSNTSGQDIASTNNLATYENESYSFNYNKDWEVLGIATGETVGSLNRRVGALQLNIEDKGRISVITHSNTTLNEYIDEHKQNYYNSTDEGGGFKLISEESYKGNSLNGYKVVFEQLDLLYVSYLLEYNNTVYEIEYPGSEANYNELKTDLEEMVNSFKAN